MHVRERMTKVMSTSTSPAESNCFTKFPVVFVRTRAYSGLSNAIDYVLTCFKIRFFIFYRCLTVVKLLLVKFGHFRDSF